MASNSPDGVIAAPDRRPAIWPWLVMPLATLALFYGLTKLQQVNDVSAGAPATHSAAANAQSPDTQ